MAITRPTLAGPGSRPVEVNAPFAVNFHSADFGAGGLDEELEAAPTRAGSALYLTHVTMALVADSVWGYIIDARVSLRDGAGDVAFGPIQLQALGGTPFKKDWPKDAPLKITDNKALDCVGVYAGGGYDSAVFVFVEGFIGDSPIV